MVPNKLQTETFLSYEADAWFERNKSALSLYKGDQDEIVSIINNYDVYPKRVLEIGCSAGYRLNTIATKFDCEVYGIEPSLAAIEYGKGNYPNVNFTHGVADDILHENDFFDVVIVGFVFYVIDRNLLLKTISEIDRVLKNGGVLLIVDFFSESSLKNVYHHITEFKAYSYKQNYYELFTASKLYYLLDLSTFSHSTKKLDSSSDYHDKYSVALLKKDLNASYK